jgi:hypothetical protein
MGSLSWVLLALPEEAGQAGLDQVCRQLCQAQAGRSWPQHAVHRV